MPINGVQELLIEEMVLINGGLMAQIAWAIAILGASYDCFHGFYDGYMGNPHN